MPTPAPAQAAQQPNFMDGMVQNQQPAQAAQQPGFMDGLVDNNAPKNPWQTKTEDTKTDDQPQGILDYIGKANQLVSGTQIESMRGSVQAGARMLAHVVNIVKGHYAADATDIPEYRREHPGASIAEAWNAIRGIGPDGKPTTPYMPESVKTSRQHLTDAAAWLTKKGKPLGPMESSALSPVAGAAQLGGSLGFDTAEFYGLEGLLGLAAPEAAGAGATADVGEAAKAAKELSVAAKYKTAGAISDVLNKYPVVNKLTAIGLRALHAVEEGVPLDATTRQMLIGGAQGGIASEGDPEKTGESAMLGGLVNQTFEEMLGPATKYLNKLKGTTEDIAPATSGELPPPIEHALPEKPSRSDFAPTVVPEPQYPPEPQLLNVPEKPTKLPKVKPEQLGPPPTKPTLLKTPEPIEPTPRPEEPVAPAPYTPDRAPAEERFQQVEQGAAGGAAGDAVAARHLESLNQIIDQHRKMQFPMNDAQKTEVLRLRDEMANHVLQGTAPADAQQVAGAITDMGQAADVMRQGPVAARARWNDMTGGQFEEMDSQIKKLAGKTDPDSIVKRQQAQEILDKLMNAPKFGGTATPGIRSAYDTILAKADLLDGADDAFTKSYKGADRTGSLDFNSLQTNWKNFVNKEGAPEVRNALGADRFDSINDFVNNVVQEPALDKAAQAAIDEQHNTVMDSWKAQMKDADDLDAMKKQTAKAQMDSQNADMTDAHRAELAARMKLVEDAKTTAEAKNAAQESDYAENTKAYNDAMAANKKMIAEHIATKKQMTSDYQAATKAAKDSDKAKINADYKAKMDEWKPEMKRLTAINQANKALYRLQASPLRGLADKQLTSDNLLGEVAKALAKEAAKQAIKKAIPGAGLAMRLVKNPGELAKRVILGPSMKVFATAVREGGDPKVYGPVIAAMVNEDIAKQPEEQ
jgi:hypothetical protein